MVQKNGELEKLNQQKNQFLGMVAHDLRNPLNAILNYGRFLEEEAADNLGSDRLDLLFRPFSTTSVRGTQGEKSTGLGLSVVKNIVEAHGGQIGVTSKVQVGSTFEVSLSIQVPEGQVGQELQPYDGIKSLRIILAKTTG